MMTAVLPRAVVDDLRESVRGRVVTSGDAGYDRARGVGNRAIDRRPAMVVQCAGSADVIAAVQFARSQGWPVAVRGGGTGVAGFGSCDGGLVIDLSPMKGIRVDVSGARARAQGGVQWGELDHETQALGLATTGGLGPTIGIAGFTLGGGLGWLLRQYGFGCDNLVAVDVVTAEGDLVTAGSAGDPELLWGLRGGGGNFGVVTSFEYQLHQVEPIVYGGMVLHPMARAGELLRFYVDWTRRLPDELTTMFVLFTAPAERYIPTELRGVPVVGVGCCFTGPGRDGFVAMKRLRRFATPAVDLMRPLPYVAMQGLLDASAPGGVRASSEAEYVDDFDDAAIDRLVSQCGALGELSPLSALYLHHLGGVASRPPPGGSALGQRHRRFVLRVVGRWTDDTEAEAHAMWVRERAAAVRPHGAGVPYLGWVSDVDSARVQAAFGEEAYGRLVALKRRYDPANVFRINHNISPTSTRPVVEHRRLMSC